MTSTDRLYGITASVAIKAPCKVAATSPITLEGEQTIGGVSIVTGDRVLVMGQADNTTNGIYVADTSAWQRARDFDGPRDVVSGTVVKVNQGPLGGTFYTLSTADSVSIGSSAITFAPAGLMTGSFVPTASGIPTNGMYLPASNTVGIAANSTLVASFTQTGLNSTAIGVTTPATGRFTTLTATGQVTLSPLNAPVTIAPTGSGTVNIGPTTMGTINNMTIGGTVPESAIFTQATAGRLFAGNGAAGSPSITFTNDSDTGFYTPTGNTITVTCGTNPMAQFNTDRFFVGADTAANPTIDGISMQTSGIVVATRNNGPTVGFRRRTSDGSVVEFYRDTALVGTISVTGSGTAYNTSSDYRLKEDLEPLEGALDRIKGVAARRFRFKSGGGKVDGFLAHDVQAAVPEAVYGEKDAVRVVENAVKSEAGAILNEGVTREAFLAGQAMQRTVIEYIPATHIDGEPITAPDGTPLTTPVERVIPIDPIYPSTATWHESVEIPIYQGIDQGKLVPLIWAGIQELIALNELMAARVESLESGSN